MPKVVNICFPAETYKISTLKLPHWTFLDFMSIIVTRLRVIKARREQDNEQTTKPMSLRKGMKSQYANRQFAGYIVKWFATLVIDFMTDLRVKY